MSITATTTTTIDFVNEFALTEKVKGEIALLLSTVFPDTKYYGRHYYKQLPHSRLIMSTGGRTIGHVAMDYRAMNLDGSLIHVLGVVDMAIEPEYQGLGLGSQLMQRLEQLAVDNKNNIDFLFLVTGTPIFYEKLGFQTVNPKVSWMKIFEGRNYGMGHEQVDDCTLMYKKVADKNWVEGELDMLGYWY